MTFTKPTETRYRSPSGRQARAITRGIFTPTLRPLPAELPENVADYMQSLNRRERRRFAAKARAHAAKRAASPQIETIERSDGVAHIDRKRGTLTIDAGTLGVTGPHKPGPDGAIPSPATDGVTFLDRWYDPNA